MAGRDLFADEEEPVKRGRDLFADTSPPPPTPRIKTEIPSQIQQVTAEKPAEPWYEDLAEGVVSSGLGTVAGIADLVGYEGLNETARDWKEDAEESGWGTAGQMIGEVGQFALPAGAAVKALKGTSRLAKAAKAYQQANKVKTALAGEAALGGVLGGAQLEEEGGDSRLTNALQGAGLGVLGAGVAGGLGKAVKGFKKSPSGEILMRKTAEGLPPVNLSAGQASTGVPQAVEELLSYLPLSARPVAKLREAGTKGWTNRVINEANPAGKDLIEGIGEDAIGTLTRNVKSGYDDAWRLADTTMTNDSRRAINKQIKRMSNLLTGDEKVSLARIKRTIDQQFPMEKIATGKNADGVMQYKNVRPKEALPDARKTIDRAIAKEVKSGSMGKSAPLSDAVNELRTGIRSGIGPEARQALSTMDSNYTKFLAVRDATKAANTAETAGDFSAKQLNAQISKYGRGNKETPLFKSMREGMETVDKPKTGGVLDKWRRVVQMVDVGATGPVETLLNTTVGETAAQRMLKGQDFKLFGKRKGYGEANQEALAEALRRYGIKPIRGIQGFNE